MTHRPPHQSLKLVVLVSGRGSNLQAIINAITARQIESRITAVISNRSEAPALARAREAGIPTIVIPSKNRPQRDFHAEMLTTLSKLSPDLIILAGFMKILPKEIIDHFPLKIINIHPSLLPLFRGLDAQRLALEAGVSKTGCTVHFVDEGCDTGSIILQATESILAGDTVETLSERLLKKEHETLVKAIQMLEESCFTRSQNFVTGGP